MAVTAEVSTLIDAPRADVWRTLTDNESVGEWFMGATVRTDWKVGSPITWSGEWKGKPYEDKGEILVADRDERLSYSHWSAMSGAADEPDNYHVVDITLSDATRSTKVVLTQANANGRVTAADREHRKDYEQNWTSVLEGLKKAAES